MCVCVGGGVTMAYCSSMYNHRFGVRPAKVLKLLRLKKTFWLIFTGGGGDG